MASNEIQVAITAQNKTKRGISDALSSFKKLQKNVSSIKNGGVLAGNQKWLDSTTKEAVAKRRTSEQNVADIYAKVRQASQQVKQLIIPLREAYVSTADSMQKALSKAKLIKNGIASISDGLVKHRQDYADRRSSTLASMKRDYNSALQADPKARHLLKNIGNAAYGKSDSAYLKAVDDFNKYAVGLKQKITAAYSSQLKALLKEERTIKESERLHEQRKVVAQRDLKVLENEYSEGQKKLKSIVSSRDAIQKLCSSYNKSLRNAIREDQIRSQIVSDLVNVKHIVDQQAHDSEAAKRKVASKQTAQGIADKYAKNYQQSPLDQAGAEMARLRNQINKALKGEIDIHWSEYKALLRRFQYTAQFVIGEERAFNATFKLLLKGKDAVQKLAESREKEAAAQAKSNQQAESTAKINSLTAQYNEQKKRLGSRSIKVMDRILVELGKELTASVGATQAQSRIRSLKEARAFKEKEMLARAQADDNIKLMEKTLVNHVRKGGDQNEKFIQLKKLLVSAYTKEYGQAEALVKTSQINNKLEQERQRILKQTANEEKRTLRHKQMIRDQAKRNMLPAFWQAAGMNLGASGGKLGNFISGVPRLYKSLRGVGMGSVGSFAVTGAAVAAGAAIAVLGAAIQKVTSIVKESIKAYMAYESTLHTTRAIAGLSAGQMENLDSKIEHISSGSVSTMEEVAAGAKALAKAGFSSDEITQSVGAVNSLAIAAEQGHEFSATMLADTIRSFGLDPKASSQVADKMTAAVTSSSQNFDNLKNALAYSSTSTRFARMTFDDNLVSLMALADLGMKGSRAGRMVKNVSTRLSSNSTAQAEYQRLGFDHPLSQLGGQDLAGIVKQISERMAEKGYTEQQKNAAYHNLFGTWALEASKLENVDTGKYRDALVSSSGKANEIAEAHMEGLNGSIKGMGALYDVFKNQIGKAFEKYFLPILEKFRAVNFPIILEKLKMLFEEIFAGLSGGVSKLEGGLSNFIFHAIDNTRFLVQAFTSLAGSLHATGAALGIFNTLVGLSNITKGRSWKSTDEQDSFFLDKLLKVSNAKQEYNQHRANVLAAEQEFKSGKISADEYKEKLNEFLSYGTEFHNDASMLAKTVEFFEGRVNDDIFKKGARVKSYEEESKQDLAQINKQLSQLGITQAEMDKATLGQQDMYADAEAESANEGQEVLDKLSSLDEYARRASELKEITGSDKYDSLEEFLSVIEDARKIQDFDAFSAKVIERFLKIYGDSLSANFSQSAFDSLQSGASDFLNQIKAEFKGENPDKRFYLGSKNRDAFSKAKEEAEEAEERRKEAERLDALNTGMNLLGQNAEVARIVSEASELADATHDESVQTQIDNIARSLAKEFVEAGDDDERQNILKKFYKEVEENISPKIDEMTKKAHRWGQLTPKEQEQFDALSARREELISELQQGVQFEEVPDHKVLSDKQIREELLGISADVYGKGVTYKEAIEAVKNGYKGDVNAMRQDQWLNDYYKQLYDAWQVQEYNRQLLQYQANQYNELQLINQNLQQLQGNVGGGQGNQQERVFVL